MPTVARGCIFFVCGYYDAMKNMAFYIETMGCQMNKLDSELIVGQMEELGYLRVDEPADASVVIYNTCSVRQHAEDKVISKVGQFRKRHREQKDLVLAVVGCMAERLGQSLLDEHGEVDVVCGPGQLHELGGLIERALEGRERLVAQNDPDAIEQLEQLDASRSEVDSAKPFMSFVRAMRGCNNYCSYCIVPYVRGRERSRSIDHIVEESERLVDRGVKEITLLGQTVNYYDYCDGDKKYDLADVLERLNDINGLARIRFVTNYPNKFGDRIFEAMAGLDKVCEYLHIPAQSGSDRMLKAMNRHYTVGEYVELIERGRSIVPGLSVEDNQRFVGQKLEILVEGPSKKPHLDGVEGQLQLVGRTRGDHIVVFAGTEDMVGQMKEVNIVRASALTLFGEL